MDTLPKSQFSEVPFRYKWLTFTWWLFMLGFAPMAHAVTWQGLQQWLATHPNFTAQFEQSVVTESENISNPTNRLTSPPQNSTLMPNVQKGKMWLNLPQHLRWEILAGDKLKNLVLVDAKKAETWSYDPDLQQAIHQPLHGVAGMGTSPAEILLNLSRKNGLKALQKNFVLSVIQAEDGSWLMATPKKSSLAGDSPQQNSMGFQWIRLKMDDEGLSAMQIRDGLDRQININLTQRATPATLPAAIFQFTPPDGVDVLDSTLSQ